MEEGNWKNRMKIVIGMVEGIEIYMEIYKEIYKEIEEKQKEKVERKYRNWIEKDIWKEEKDEGVYSDDLEKDFEGVQIKWKMKDIVIKGEKK